MEGIFNRLYGKFKELKDPVQEMIRISSNPVLMARMPYGRHKGLLFSEVPKDYLEWLLTTQLGEDTASFFGFRLDLDPEGVTFIIRAVGQNLTFGWEA